MFELRKVNRMGTTFLGRLVVLLIASGLLLPCQAAEGTKTESLFSGPRHPLDKATYLRMRLQLLGVLLDGKPACELGTPAGREEELRRAIRVFPEIRKDTQTLKAINSRQFRQSLYRAAIAGLSTIRKLDIDSSRAFGKGLGGF
jgi:hypothetical protein